MWAKAIFFILSLKKNTLIENVLEIQPKYGFVGNLANRNQQQKAIDSLFWGIWQTQINNKRLSIFSGNQEFKINNKRLSIAFSGESGNQNSITIGYRYSFPGNLASTNQKQNSIHRKS